MRRACALLTVIALGCSACSGSAPTADDPSDESTVRSDRPAEVDSERPDDIDPAPDEVLPETTAAARDLPPAFDALPEPSISLSSPMSGAGRRPELSWTPIEGAVIYSVRVLTAAADPYWAWEGRETSVLFGGPALLEEASAGPALSRGMQWYVVAYDDDGAPLAQSVVQPIEP